MTSQNVGTDVLRALHRIHQQLSDLRNRLERGPKQIRASQSAAEHRGQQLAAIREETKVLRIAADKRQLQLKQGEEKIKELKLKLNSASSNREYQALRDQIAAIQMANSVLDDEILEVWEKTEQFQQKIAQSEAGLAQAEQKAETVRARVDEEEPRIRGDLTRLQAELAQCEASLPADVRELYDRVVRQRGEDALAVIESHTCSGCHQQVPLNMIAEIMLSHPMFCKACGRLLYMPEDRSPGQ